MHSIEQDYAFPSTEPIKEGAPWKLIAVMGVTGSGKSSFVQRVSGNKKVVVGDDLSSCTSELKGYVFHHRGYNINLVDSPGFNDTYRSETDVLQDIALWLRDTYEGDTKLTGIIYLHAINHARMEGSALRNLKMFRELCGPEPLKNIVLATTFWDAVAPKVGERRENELCDKPEFWGSMIQRGSRMARIDGTQSCIHIIEGLLTREARPLQIQRELVEQSKTLQDTAAGQVVSEELVRLEAKYKAEKEQMRQEMEEALQKRDLEMQEILHVQQQNVEEQLAKVKRQQEQLKADRRSDLRRQQVEFESIILDLQDKLAGSDRRMQQDRAAFERCMRENQKQNEAIWKKYHKYNEAAWKRWETRSVEELVAAVRVEEGKLRAQDRERLEAEIERLQKFDTDYAVRPEDGWKPKAKKAGQAFLKVLQALLPLTSLITLGVPLGS